MNMNDQDPDDDLTRTHVVLTSGMLVAQYRIVEKIGAGGMGEVYLAEDTKLNRRVAMKFLPAHLAAGDDIKARFVREAQTLAKLNHPNVVSVYEVGELNNRPYYVMELVEGDSLKHISDNKQLSIDQIVGYAMQICQGLAEAHRAGIVHRDIKPANIIVDNSGRIRLLDFGLAAMAGDDRLTRTGSTLGTVSYMSPEQASGREVDHRTDLFSLGVVLYELIAGRTPFKRDNEGATFRAIIEDNPEPLTRYKSDIPEKLLKIVGDLLEKDRELRSQSAEEVIAALKRLTYDSSQSVYSRAVTVKPRSSMVKIIIITAVVLALTAATYIILGRMNRVSITEEKTPMIAVLPFENLGSPDDQYFADGMTEEITSRLAGIDGLGVISRYSAMKFDPREYSLQDIGKQLNVRYVLEGTIRWSKVDGQPKVRITPQLIRVSDDRHIWADNYERALMEVFAIQADIAEKIVEQLGITLLESDRHELASIPTRNAEAYQLYLKALQEIRQKTDYSGSLFAQSALDSAVAIDPTFALAYALRSEAYSHGAGGAPESRLAKVALESANRSLELKPGLPEGRLALGYYYYNVEEDMENALDQFLLAREKLRNDPELLNAISNVRIEQGNLEEALEYRSLAAELDPLNGRRHAAMASILKKIRRFDEAIQSIDRAIALDPGNQDNYEDKIDIVIAYYGDIEKVKHIINQALLYCDTTGFVLKNSSITRYIPELKTDSIIGSYIQRYRADSTENKHVFFSYLKTEFYYKSHLDILEGYDDEALELIGSYENPSGFYGWRGLLLSFAGKCDEAVELGLKAKERSSKIIRARGTDLVISSMDMARIYSNCGDYDKAMNELEFVLSQETYVTVNTLKFEHWIDPFRDSPRYKELMTKYSAIDGIRHE